MTPANTKVREWRQRFRKTPLAARVVAGLDGHAAEIWRRTFDLLQRESPEYRNSVDEEFTNESQCHCKELLQTIIAIASGRADKWEDPFPFVRTHAEWRARHQVPLVASLHAYRLAHKTYGEVTRELLFEHPQRDEALHSLAMLSDFWIEFFDYIGSVISGSARRGRRADGGPKNAGLCWSCGRSLTRGRACRRGSAAAAHSVRHTAGSAYGCGRSAPVPASEGRPARLGADAAIPAPPLPAAPIGSVRQGGRYPGR